MNKNFIKSYKIYLLNFTTLFFLSCNAEQITQKAHLTSAWYPQEKTELTKELKFYIKKAQEKFKLKNNPADIKIIIAPHAGYYYSGLCAATAYQTLLSENIKNSKIKNIIILSPSHTKNFEGIATPNFDNYENCLGSIDIDKNKIEKLKTNSSYKFVEKVFEQEHAIEIQLPFLQHTVENFTIIPLIVGYIKEQDYKIIANHLKNIIDENTLIVISSDFIHYGKNYDYTPFDIFILDNIRYYDTEALYAIGKQSYNNFNTLLKKTNATICGQNCIKILLKLLEEKPFGEIEPRLTCYYTSAQMEQARNNNYINIKKLLSDLSDDLVKNSVSYAGLIFTTEKNNTLKQEDQLTDYEKKSLYNLAKRSIENEFKENKIPSNLLSPVRTLSLDKNSGSFVTLNKNGELRGCIGRIISNQELFKTIQEMAIASAFNDNRFNKVTKNELENLDISISVLTSPKGINSYNEITLGKHGIILKKLTKSGNLANSVFLPKVPVDWGWNLQKTLEQLSLKAGLDKDAWQQDCYFDIFESFEIKNNLD